MNAQPAADVRTRISFESVVSDVQFSRRICISAVSHSLMTVNHLPSTTHLPIVAHQYITSSLKQPLRIPIHSQPASLPYPHPVHHHPSPRGPSSFALFCSHPTPITSCIPKLHARSPKHHAAPADQQRPFLRPIGLGRVIGQSHSRRRRGMLFVVHIAFLRDTPRPGLACDEEFAF